MLTIKEPMSMSDKIPHVYNRNLIPLLESSVIMIYGQGGIGKSMAAIHSAIKFVENNPNKKAVLWLTEDSEGENRKRFVNLVKAFSDKPTDYFNSRIHFISSEPIRFTVLKDGNALPSSDFHIIESELKQYDLIVLDPLLQFQGGDENNNTHAGAMMGLLKSWTAEYQKIVLLLHHATFYADTPDKPRARGAKEWVNGTRGAYSLKRLKKPSVGATKDEIMAFYEKLEVTLEKDNGLSSVLMQKYGSTTFNLTLFPPLNCLKEY